MNTQSGLLAAPPFAVPPESAMADVIDSLKRLERAGSEASKTTQKLIQAAVDIEILILAQFKNFGKPFDIDVPNIQPTNAVWMPPYKFRYTVGDKSFVNGHDGKAVSANRASAMRFAEDLANGLLDAIEDYIATDENKAKRAIGTLEAALGRMKSPN